VTLACTTPTGARTLEATTDEHGLFSLDAPPGMHGAITTRITCGARAFDGQSLAADALPVVLTPIDERTPKQLLNGSWHFAADPDPSSPVPAAANASSPFKDAIEVYVPSHLIMHGLEPRDGVAVGRRRFARSPGLNHPGGA
jgi:hypothetical protein